MRVWVTSLIVNATVMLIYPTSCQLKSLCHVDAMSVTAVDIVSNTQVEIVEDAAGAEKY